MIEKALPFTSLNGAGRATPSAGDATPPGHASSTWTDAWRMSGPIFEVTREGEIVWEFWDPEHQPFYRAKRYPAELVNSRLG